MPRFETIDCVALLSPCGHGNLGDAAIQQAAIAGIRERQRQCRILGVTLVPSDTQSRHGIESYPIAAVSRPHYGVVTKSASKFSQETSRTDQRAKQVYSIIQSARNKLTQALAAIARVLLPERMPYLIRLETAHWRMACAVMKRVDVLVISGGGQLDAYWGGSWGHPYALFKWCLLARLLGKQVVFLSVGLGSLDSRSSRIFARTAFSLAGYRSYRDQGSRDACERMGFATDAHVYPDLAFGLRVRSDSKSADRIGAVGISPMIYKDPTAWPDKNQQEYDQYVEKLIEIARTCLAKGRHVRIFASDGPDRRPVEMMRQSLETYFPGCDGSRLQIVDVRTAEEFVLAASRVGVMIVTRLHGAILSFVARSNVIALSYDRKVTALMSDLGQTDHCFNADIFTSSEVLALVGELVDRGLRSEQEEYIRTFEEQLQEQYDFLFGDPVAQAQ